MKQKKIFFLILLFTILFVYITNINTIPENIILFQNESYRFSFLKGIEVEGDNVSIVNSLFQNLATIKSENTGNSEFRLTALGKLPVKDITVSVIPAASVIPSGNAIGVKLYAEGVLVVGSSPVEGTDGKTYEPYLSTNITNGDTIISINNKNVENIDELVDAVNQTNGQLSTIIYKHHGETFQQQICPVQAFDDGNYKMGFWVRDGAMGIGTLTFYEPESQSFAALGHGISDIDIKELINIESGTLNEAAILSVIAGKKAAPGEIRGMLKDNSVLGEIYSNSQYGIYGKYKPKDIPSVNQNRIPVASRNEIKTGAASILCTIEGTEPKEYQIEVQKINSLSQNSTKSMIIKITDPTLLSKTGGIIQGMSGSPIIQNGKFIGAITHVFVNDPTRGYAIFGDIMLNEARNCY